MSESVIVVSRFRIEFGKDVNKNNLKLYKSFSQK
jgi:ribosomal protein S24E